MNEASPSWEIAAPLAYPRRRPDLTILADGRLLAIGGSIEGQNTPGCAMHAAEIFDPASGEWTTMASMARSRIYHSVAVLLPDGRVLAAGGENSEIGGERNYEIYSPPYLFQGSRPQITAAPDAVGYGTSFVVYTPEASTIDRAALVRPSAVTHNFDQNQRYVPLALSQAAGSVELTAPVDGNMAPPGYYMLFLLDDTGVPSVARFVRLGDDVTSAGSVPDGTGVAETPLTIEPSTVAGKLDLAWGESCSNADADYVVYEGTLGDFASHVPVVDPSCTTGGETSATITPGAGSRYYLVVAVSDTGFEGGFGVRSDGSPRPAGPTVCGEQSIGVCP